MMMFFNSSLGYRIARKQKPGFSLRSEIDEMEKQIESCKDASESEFAGHTRRPCCHLHLLSDVL
jgi:hypothetical protein